MSVYKWLHFKNAIPILANIDIPTALGLFQRATKAIAELKASSEGEPSTAAMIDALGPDFLQDVMVLVRSLDPNALTRLAMIASASVDELEECEDKPAKEKELLRVVARMEPGEVIAKVLFFIGLRTNIAAGAQSSFGTEKGENEARQTSGSSSES
jgi:hypothetical protein